MRLWAIFFCAFLPVANFGMARRPAGGDALIPVPLEPRFMETSIPGDLKLVRTNTEPENTLSVPDLRRIPLSLAAFEEDHVNEYENLALFMPIATIVCWLGNVLSN